MTSSPPSSTTNPSNGSSSLYAKIYRSVGFTRGYNFPLWVVFGGAMFAFSLSRLGDIHNYDEIFKYGYALQLGLWYYFGSGLYRIGMMLHLAAVLPAGILLILQFTPVIRHRWILLHRINGYVVMLLLFISNIGAFIVLWRKQNGSRMGIQAAEALLSIMTTTGMALAWWNIRRKQVEEHRAWMLRTMFWYGSIITSRLINLAAGPIASLIGGHWAVSTCDEIDAINREYGLSFPTAKYPQCVSAIDGAIDRGRHVAVSATVNNGAPEEVAVSILIPFAASLWISIALHVLGIEIYLRLTPRETERLRVVSYQKQLEAGFRHPGSAGLTTDRLGDAKPWAPPGTDVPVSEEK